MQIRDIMTKEVISVLPETSIEKVAMLLIDNRIHGIPVIVDNKPIGIITETDFFTKGDTVVYLPEYISFLKKGAALDEDAYPEEKAKIDMLLKTAAADVMSHPCITINENADIAYFINLVQERSLKSMPVVDAKGDLVGIVTMADVIHLINMN